MREKMVTVGTHNGEFHSDEIFAIAILKKVHKNIKITRTRNYEILKKMDIRLDVGRDYNPQTNDYDHHQPSFKLKRDNGIPYASAGLIWKHFGKKVINSNKAFEYIDKRLIQPIDAIDNGVSIAEYKTILPYTLSDVISSFNIQWNEKQDEASENYAFNKALGIAEIILNREINKANSLKQGEEIVLRSIKGDPDFIILDRKKLPYENVVFDKPKIKFVIFPDQKENWISIAVRSKAGGFDRRALFPEEWAGLGEELAQKTNIKGAKFCHKNRFIVTATTKEGAIELTKLALKNLTK
jgi:uncharacterized UPF0160 family protein